MKGANVDGTPLADEREALMWSPVNCFHPQMTRLDRAVDRITPEMRDLEKAQDDTEVKAWELETMTDTARNLGDRATPSRPCTILLPRPTACIPATSGPGP